MLLGRLDACVRPYRWKVRTSLSMEVSPLIRYASRCAQVEVAACLKRNPEPMIGFRETGTKHRLPREGTV